MQSRRRRLVGERPLCTYSSQKNVPTDGVEARCQSCVTVKPPREPRGVGVAAVCATACRRGDRQALTGTLNKTKTKKKYPRDVSGFPALGSLRLQPLFLLLQ